MKKKRVDQSDSRAYLQKKGALFCLSLSLFNADVILILNKKGAFPFRIVNGNGPLWTLFNQRRTITNSAFHCLEKMFLPLFFSMRIVESCINILYPKMKAFLPSNVYIFRVSSSGLFVQVHSRGNTRKKKRSIHCSIRAWPNAYNYTQSHAYCCWNIRTTTRMYTIPSPLFILLRYVVVVNKSLFLTVCGTWVMNGGELSDAYKGPLWQHCPFPGAPQRTRRTIDRFFFFFFLFFRG